MGLASCYRDSDDFNRKAAAKICAYNARGPSEPFLNYADPMEDDTFVITFPEYHPYGPPACEDDVIDNLDRCSATCDYSPRKARRCLRKLNRALRDGSYEESELAVCDRVYSCEGTPRETSRACRISTQSCAVGGRGSPYALMGLLLAGVWGRRRRRGRPG